MSSIRCANFIGGGGTDLTKAVRTGIADIRRFGVEENLERPQLLIVTDGRGELEVEPEDCRGIEVHAFVCNGTNRGLRTLVEASGALILENL